MVIKKCAKDTLEAGLSMQSIRVHGAGALDIGTPENLAKAVRLHHS